jgi:hypothetical protein
MENILIVLSGSGFDRHHDTPWRKANNSSRLAI